MKYPHHPVFCSGGRPPIFRWRLLMQTLGDISFEQKCDVLKGCRKKSTIHCEVWGDVLDVHHTMTTRNCCQTCHRVWLGRERASSRADDFYSAISSTKEPSCLCYSDLWRSFKCQHICIICYIKRIYKKNLERETERETIMYKLCDCFVN